MLRITSQEVDDEHEYEEVTTQIRPSGTSLRLSRVTSMGSYRHEAGGLLCISKQRYRPTALKEGHTMARSPVHAREQGALDPTGFGEAQDGREGFDASAT